MKIKFVDPEQHGETGNPMPYWIYFGVLTEDQRQTIMEKVEAMLGPGSLLPSLTALWGERWKYGQWHIKCRHREDRELIVLAV